MRSSWKQLRTFLTSVLMAGRAVHVIPHVPMPRPEGMDAVLPPKVVWLFRSPVAKFVWTTIHPGEQSFCGNVIQTDPRCRHYVCVGYIRSLLDFQQPLG